MKTRAGQAARRVDLAPAAASAAAQRHKATKPVPRIEVEDSFLAGIQPPRLRGLPGTDQVHHGLTIRLKRLDKSAESLGVGHRAS